MSKINPNVIESLLNKTGLSLPQVYKKIQDKANATYLPRHLAALVVAAENGLNINKFASSDELTEIRNNLSSSHGNPINILEKKQPVTLKSPKPKKTKTKSKKRAKDNSVFIVHGRNEKIRKALFSFLRSISLNPIEWNQAIKLTGKASPYVGEILDSAFNHAAAIVVLFTPDDLAKLKEEFRTPSESGSEKKLMGQPRPNVLFEAGMAYGRNSSNTVLVQVGKIKPFSDIGGRHLVHLSNDPKKRQELITKLSNAGCIVDYSGTDWQTEGDFDI